MELTVEHVKNTTAFREDWQARGAIETLKWLEAGAPHQLDGLEGKFNFNMRHFVLLNGCGTTCCIAGAIAQFGVPLIDPVRVTDNEQEWGALTLDMEFGLTALSRITLSDEERDELHALFYLDGVPTTKVLSEITPAEAAYALRHYLTAGTTLWPDDMLVGEL